MPKTRTFVAVDASDAVRAGVAKLVRRLAPEAQGVRWVSPDALHFTLHFLGDLTDQELADACLNVKQASAGVAGFTLEAAGLGAFPSAERPRVLWVGVRRGAANLVALHAAIGESLAGMGLRGENRPFVPHLTIGKSGHAGRDALAALARPLAEQADAAAGTLVVSESIVFASELRRDGPRYTPLARCPLAGR